MAFLFLIAAVFPATALAQDLTIPPAVYPPVSQKAGNANGFVPSGWKIEREARGDISGDGRPDLAIVVREQDPRKRLAHDGMGISPLDTNPRMLIIALGNIGGGYVLADENHSLIPRHEWPTMSDPFGEDGDMTIANSALKITLFHFMNAGGWNMGPTHFTLRWRDDALRLIGYDGFDAARNTGETTGLSVNFLTGRVKQESGRIDNDRAKARWHQLASRRLPTTDEIGVWDEYDPGGWVMKVFG